MSIGHVDTKLDDWKDYAIQLVDILKGAEWVYDTGLKARLCPSCEGEHPDHEEECELAALLAVDLRKPRPSGDRKEAARFFRVRVSTFEEEFSDG